MHDTAPATLWDRIKSIFSSKPEEPRIILSAPLVLSWLYYGKSFEAMVSMVSKQAGSPEADEADRQSCSFVTRQIISVSIKSGFRTRADWDEYFAMNEAVKENRIGEWALQSATAEMESDTDSNINGAESTDSDIDATSKIQRTAGRKKIQERPLIDYLNCKNKTGVLQSPAVLFPLTGVPSHQALPYYVLKGIAAGGRYAYRQGIQCWIDPANSGFAVFEERKCHTTGRWISENGKAHNQGRERPVRTTYRK